jgi:hypothetical protein
MTAATPNRRMASNARRPGIVTHLRGGAVFQEAPDLLRGLDDAADLHELASVKAPVLPVERGPWRPPVLRADAHAHFGLLVLDGVFLRRVSLNGRTGAELLGSGDLLQPWVRQPPYDTLAADSEWEVVNRARLAVLDQRFAARVAPWPAVAAALLMRATERSRMLAFQHVASHIPGLDGRLMALMWALADRWGRVSRDGIVIPLPLTHAVLAELVGASRPSVSTALSQLARDGVLRRASGGWLLDQAAPFERGGTGMGEAHGGHLQPPATAATG